MDAEFYNFILINKNSSKASDLFSHMGVLCLQIYTWCLLYYKQEDGDEEDQQIQGGSTVYQEE